MMFLTESYNIPPIMTMIEQIIDSYGSPSKRMGKEDRRRLLSPVEASPNEALNNKKMLRDSLLVEVSRLEGQIQLRERETFALEEKMKEIMVRIAQQEQLEIKERLLESEHEDLYKLQTKLTREIRLLEEEHNIKRGKAIIEHNKIKQTLQEQANQRKRKDILHKHLDDVKRGSEVLKKRVKHLSEQLKKKHLVKSQIQETQLHLEIASLQKDVRLKEDQLVNVQKMKSNYVQNEELARLKEYQQKLRKQCEGYDAQRLRYKKLSEEKQALQERISFLKNVDSEFINQKKMLLLELTQKQTIFQSQREQYKTSLSECKQRWERISLQYPNALQHIKKKVKRKRQPKQKNINEIEESTPTKASEFEVKQQETMIRWRLSNKMKKTCWRFIIFCIITGLILSQLIITLQ